MAKFERKFGVTSLLSTINHGQVCILSVSFEYSFRATIIINVTFHVVLRNAVGHFLVARNCAVYRFDSKLNGTRFDILHPPHPGEKVHTVVVANSSNHQILEAIHTLPITQRMASEQYSN